MLSNIRLHILPSFTLLLLLVLGASPVHAAIDPPGVLNPTHRAELNTLLEKAQAKAGQNLNRYAIDDLNSFDKLLDSFSALEIKDSIKLLELEYRQSTGGRSDELAAKRLSIDELTKAKFTNQNRYNQLIRKAGIAFAAWFVIIIILLQIRKRHLRRQGKLLEESSAKLASQTTRTDFGKKYILTNKKIKPSLEKINRSAESLSQNFQGSNNLLTGIEPEVTKKIAEEIKAFEHQAGTELRISSYLASLESDPSSEKQTVDINSICDTAVEIAMRGGSFIIPPEVLSISKDLEKNLPKINVIPEAINALLLNILSNSLMALRAKYDEGVKGYQPKIVVSTRILPRFLQIRIRDNGDGIPKEHIDKVMQEFYSLRTAEKSAGLGLTDSLKIVGEPHKSELKLESIAGDGTDIYIKFFLS